MPADDVTLRIGAEDKATPVIEKVDKAATKLDKTKVMLTVDAKVAAALAAFDDVAANATKTAQAAAALGRALGPELAGKADLGLLVRGFQQADLSLDDIIDKADQLGSHLRQTAAGGGLEALGGGARKVAGDVEQLGRSADTSRGALSGMIGNSVEQLAEMSGTSGETTQAIGQLGEAMARAAIDGESMKTVFADFAAAVAPILAVGAAFGAVSNVISEEQAQRDASTARIKQFGEAMRGAADDALGLTESMRSNTDELEAFNVQAASFGGLVKEFGGEALRGIPLLGGAFKNTGKDLSNLIPILSKAQLSVFAFNKSVESGGRVGDDFERQLLAAANAGTITTAEFEAVAQAVSKYGIETLKAQKNQTAFNVDQAETNALLQQLLDAQNPLRRFTAQWNALMADLVDGKVDTKETVDEVNALAKALGIDPHEVISIALGGIADKGKEVQAQFEATGKALQDWAERSAREITDAAEAATKLSDAQSKINDEAAAFNQMQASGNGMRAAFALGNAPLEFLGRITDIHDGMRDLATFIKDPKGLKGIIPNIFDPNDVHAGDFLNKIKSLRDPIQSEIVDAFATGGAPAAQATADRYVDELFHVLKGKLSRDQIRSLLDLGDMEVKLKIAVDEKTKAQAEKELSILTGVTGQSPWSASIALALEAGTLTPAAAKILIEKQLRAANVEVPSTLATPDVGKAKSEADRWAARPENSVNLLTMLGAIDAKSEDKAHTDGQAYATGHPIVFPSTIAPPTTKPKSLSDFFAIFDAGGTVRGPGGVVAERRPEIVNERYLVTQPTVVPAGTRVTSGARTARILRTRGTRGLRGYDAGGTVAGSTRHVTVNVNAAVIGNRYEVMRAVVQAERQAERLLGTRR